MKYDDIEPDSADRAIQRQRVYDRVCLRLPHPRSDPHCGDLEERRQRRDGADVDDELHRIRCKYFDRWEHHNGCCSGQWGAAYIQSRSSADAGGGSC